MHILPEYLDLEPNELEDLTDQPDKFILERVCEWNNWFLSGTYPEMLIEKYLQVILANEQMYYRILNARSHKRLETLTMRQLQQVLKQELAIIQAWKTDKTAFLDQLYDRWLDIYNDPLSDDVISLEDLYSRMKQHRPDYRREYFGLDLNHLLAHEQPQIDNCNVTVYPAEKSTKGFWIWDYHHGLHLIEGISFDEIVAVAEEPTLNVDTLDVETEEDIDDNPVLISFNWDDDA